MISMFIILYLFVGFTMGIIPYISQSSIVFGVTLPPKELKNNQILKNKKRYFLLNLEIAIVLSVLILIITQLFSPTEEMMSIYLLLTMTLQLIASSVIYIIFYQKMRALKLKFLESGEKTSKKIVIDMSYHEQVAVFPTSYLIGIQLLIIILTVWLTLANYSLIPNEIVMQWNFKFEPSRIVDKSFMSIFMIPMMQVFYLVVMSLSNEAYKNGKQRVASKYTSEISQKFRHMSSYFTLVLTLLIQFLFVAIQLTSVIPIFNIKTMLILTMIVTGMILVATIWLMLTYGQAGSRMVKENKVENYYDDDEHWILGAIYVNKEDPSFWVEKRTGLGMTVNFAKWQSWVFIIGIIVIPVILTMFI